MCPRAEAAVVKEGKILSATPIQEVQVPINDLEGMCQDCCQCCHDFSLEHFPVLLGTEQRWEHLATDSQSLFEQLWAQVM